MRIELLVKVREVLDGRLRVGENAMARGTSDVEGRRIDLIRDLFFVLLVKYAEIFVDLRACVLCTIDRGGKRGNANDDGQEEKKQGCHSDLLAV